MTFNLRKAIKPHEGLWSGTEFRDLLNRIRSENLGGLGWFGPDEIFKTLCQEGWLTETGSGQLRLKVTTKKAALKLKASLPEDPSIAAVARFLAAVQSHLNDSEKLLEGQGLKLDSATLHSLNASALELNRAYKAARRICNARRKE